MNNTILKALESFIDDADFILSNRIISAYCHGSAAYDDFHRGYSDLDFFIIIKGDIDKEIFEEFSLLRNRYKTAKNPYLSVLEGEIISVNALKNDIPSNAIYWGTSKDKLNTKYTLSGFSLKGLIDKGDLIYGEDIRKYLPYPSDEIMMYQINHLINTLRTHTLSLEDDIHSVDWLFLISQSIYWLRTKNTTSKTNSAKWILDNCNYKWNNSLAKALKIRENPTLSEIMENKNWLSSLSTIIQSACDTLVLERDRTI